MFETNVRNSSIGTLVVSRGRRSLFTVKFKIVSVRLLMFRPSISIEKSLVHRAMVPPYGLVSVKTIDVTSTKITFPMSLLLRPFSAVISILLKLSV